MPKMVANNSHLSKTDEKAKKSSEVEKLLTSVNEDDEVVISGFHDFPSFDDEDLEIEEESSQIDFNQNDCSKKRYRSRSRGRSREGKRRRKSRSRSRSKIRNCDYKRGQEGEERLRRDPTVQKMVKKMVEVKQEMEKEGNWIMYQVWI